MNRLRLREPHLPFGGMHVHVDLLQRHRQEEHGAREAAARENVAVYIHQRVLHRPVAHGSAVHEELNTRQRRTVTVRSGDETLDNDGALIPRQGDQPSGRLLAEHGGHAVESVARRRPRQRGSIIALDLEVHAWKRECGAGQPVRDMSPLGPGPLQELPPRRNAREEVRDLDARSDGSRGRAFSHQAALVHPDLVGVAVRTFPRAQSKAGYRRDRR